VSGDSFQTVAGPSKIEIKRKGSRFIGEVASVGSVEEALEKLAAVRKREHAATHHCYAYRVRTDDDTAFKYSDDGEPSGTAGRPIFDCLEGQGLVDAIVIVTRYYGGTKLGTGGLVRAYSDAAAEALDQAGSVERLIKEELQVDLEFGLYDQAVKFLSKIGAETISSDYSDRVRLVLAIRRSLTDRLEQGLLELSAGRAKIERGGID